MIEPCPFCGGEAKVGKFEEDWGCSRQITYSYMVYCLNDDCIASVFSIAADYDTEQEAIDAWNRRQEDD